MQEQPYSPQAENDIEKVQTLKYLGTLLSGEKVFDRPASHIHRTEALEQNLPAALSKIVTNNQMMVAESVEFDIVIGTTGCVVTNEDDDIIFAQRVGRKGGYTRFVKNRNPEPTSSITVVLKKINEGYLLLTAYIGEKAEPEPWDYHADEKSLPYWKTHALIFGSEPIIKGTETTKELW
jgi:hypothetical protein